MPTQQQYINDFLDAEVARISYIDFYTNFGIGTEEGLTGTNEDIADKYLALRIAPSTIERNGSTVNISLTIPYGEAATPSSPITAVNGDQTQITVADASLFNSSDECIEIMLSPNPIRAKIIAKSGNILTLDRAIGVSSATGILARVIIAQIGIVIGGTAGGGDGQLMRTNKYVKFRSSTSPALNVDIAFKFKNN